MFFTWWGLKVKMGRRIRIEQLRIQVNRVLKLIRCLRKSFFCGGWGVCVVWPNLTNMITWEWDLGETYLKTQLEKNQMIFQRGFFFFFFKPMAGSGWFYFIYLKHLNRPWVWLCESKCKNWTVSSWTKLERFSRHYHDISD